MIQVQSVRMHDLLSFVYYSNKYHQVVGSSSGQDNNKEKKSIHRSIEASKRAWHLEEGRTEGDAFLVVLYVPENYTPFLSRQYLSHL